MIVHCLVPLPQYLTTCPTVRRVCVVWCVQVAGAQKWYFTEISYRYHHRNAEATDRRVLFQECAGCNGHTDGFASSSMTVFRQIWFPSSVPSSVPDFKGNPVYMHGPGPVYSACTGHAKFSTPRFVWTLTLNTFFNTFFNQNDQPTYGRGPQVPPRPVGRGAPLAHAPQPLALSESRRSTSHGEWTHAPDRADEC